MSNRTAISVENTLLKRRPHSLLARLEIKLRTSFLSSDQENRKDSVNFLSYIHLLAVR